MFARLGAAVVLLVTASSAAPAPQQPPAAEQQARWAAACKDWDQWDKAAPPFKVFGNTYYVGTCGISSILIASSMGEILIDGGPANAGGLVASNVQALGFRLSSVKLLLSTHEHPDHAGGLAEVQRLTGAEAFATKAAAAVLECGKAGPDDPQFAEHSMFPPLKRVRTFGDTKVFQTGSVKVMGLATPGHTPGATSWQWRACEGAVCKTIVYADSLTPVSSDGYRFSDHPAYVAAFRQSLDRIAALDCDILLSPHPSASGMRDKLLEGDLTDPQGCVEYSARLRKDLDARLAKEAHGG